MCRPQVACGLNHTLVVSADGMMVWAFGDGDYGKLGLGNSTAKSSPQVGAVEGVHLEPRHTISRARFLLLGFFLHHENVFLLTLSSE